MSAESPPCFWLVAGVNGAGKTTLAAHADIRAILGTLELINPDALVKGIQQADPGLSLAEANVQAVRTAEDALWGCLIAGRSVLVETVLSTTKYEPALIAARRFGYRTGMIYIGLPDIRYSVDRVATRVAASGHDVPREKLLSRWERSHDNLVRFLPLLDDLFIFSNAGREPLLVAVRTAGERIRLLVPDALPEVTNRLQGLIDQ